VVMTFKEILVAMISKEIPKILQNVQSICSRDNTREVHLQLIAKSFISLCLHVTPTIPPSHQTPSKYLINNMFWSALT